MNNDEPEGYKKTELGLLPKEWEVVRLKDVVTTKKGRKPKTLSEDVKKDYLPYLTAEYFRTKRAKQFASTENESLITVDKEDVVFIWDGSNAGDVFTGLSGVLASTMIKISPKKESLLTRKILYYYLKTKFYQFNTQTTGSTIPHVNKNMFENLLIPLPPLSEQKKIAFVLSTVQDAKEKTEDVIKATKELKKSMMKHLFTYGHVPVEEAKNVPLKETEIGLVPRDWEVVRLVEVSKITMGQSPPGTTYNTIGDGKPFLQGKAEFGFLHPKHVKYTTKPLKIAMKGSVLLSVRAPVGDVNLADQEYCIGRGLSSLSLTEGNNIFLFYLLNYFKSKIESEGTGSTFKAINKSKLENFKIPLPPLPIQQKIASILSAIDQKIEAEESKKKALEDLFKSLLHNLMTAKVRVNNLEV